jgi:ABC-type cobalt transport system substrate-binding protein
MLRSEKIQYFILLLSLLVLIFIPVALSEGMYGGADNIAHFRISKYAFTYPYLFLDHWGKPLFTLLSSPFSQFGFNGLRFFNIVTGILAAYLSFRVAQELKIKNPPIVLFFVIFSPLFFRLFFSGLTEILFSFVLILAIFFFVRKKYLFSTLVISFLPFVRTEGIIFFVIWLILLGINKKWKIIPLLFSGTLIYSLIGWSYYGDILWVFHKMPYTGAANIYGRGELLHFVNSADHIIGIPLIILFLFGLVSYVRSFIKNEFKSARQINEGFLVFGGMAIYFVAHSYVWWKGIGGSLGLVRVMACIIPLAAIICARGANILTDILPKKRIVQSLLPVLLVLIVTLSTILGIKIPMKAGRQEKVLIEAAEWVKKSKYFHNKIYYKNYVNMNKDNTH